jgi:hypothetical protein
MPGGVSKRAAVTEAYCVLERWRLDYNNHRLHSALESHCLSATPHFLTGVYKSGVQQSVQKILAGANYR